MELEAAADTSQSDRMAELRNIYENQQKWINFLMRKKFLLQLIPQENVVAIAKKMEIESFAGLMRSCKWVNAVVGEKRATFILNSNKELVLDHSKMNGDISVLEKHKYCRLKRITFRNFHENANELSVVLYAMKGLLLAREVHLVNTAAVKEVFLYLRPKYLTMTVGCLLHRHCCPISDITKSELPGHLENIDVELQSPSAVEMLERVLSFCIGKSQRLTIKVPWENVWCETLYEHIDVCMMNLGINKRKQEIFFVLAENPSNDEFPGIRERFMSNILSSGLFQYDILAHPSSIFAFQSAGYDIVAMFFSRKREESGCKMTITMSYLPTENALRQFYTSHINQDRIGYRELRIFIDFIFASVYFYNISLNEKYNAFENIKENTLRLQRSQLEAPETQLFNDWKQKIPLPQLPLELPAEEETEKQSESIVKSVTIREQWINFLKKGKYILQAIPDHCVVEIVKRMDIRDFVKILATTKWINELIDRSRFKFIKYVPREFVIRRSEIINMDSWATVNLKGRSNFKFKTVKFANFKGRNASLQSVVSSLAGKNILCDELILSSTPVTKEMVEYLCPHTIRFEGNYFNGIQDYPKTTKLKACSSNKRFLFNWSTTSFIPEDINEGEILKGEKCCLSVKPPNNRPLFIYIEKTAKGIVAGIRNDTVKKFSWQFVTTIEDFEKLFWDGALKDGTDPSPEEVEALSKIRSDFFH